jgi:prepilin-type N-terminal cleavage/methylation domain-containing protein
VRSEGFTLLEFVIVIIIVSILSIIAVPVYRNYIEKAKMVQNVPDVKKSAADKKGGQERSRCIEAVVAALKVPDGPNPQ